MSRKNPFADIDMAALQANKPAAKPAYGMTGAAKTVVRSIEEMAENTKKLMDGEAIVELNPESIDSSYISDRLSEDDQDYKDLKRAIADNGQASPILVRPNPDNPVRYMIVFGHRRVRVARDLGIKVKAVVKKLDDIAHAVAQGQENSARSNLSFIERAYFAQNLISKGMTKDVVKSALGVDDALLSKMLGVVETIPSDLIAILGAAKGIGRDKWLSLRQIVLNPSYLAAARNHAQEDCFKSLPEAERFDKLHDYLRRYKTKSAAKTSKTAGASKTWESEDNSLSLTMSRKAKKVAIELANENAKPFGDWLSNRMDSLYTEFMQTKNDRSGD